jgi:hypothetical protein
MAKLEVAVRCPTCGGILLFFEPVSLGSGLTCDTCHTEFPFSADRVVPESVLAAEAGGGEP